jgi:hypothetical protein
MIERSVSTALMAGLKKVELAHPTACCCHVDFVKVHCLPCWVAPEGALYINILMLPTGCLTAGQMVLHTLGCVQTACMEHDCLAAG